jgi:CRP/FNR family transcriptional regulator, cyclic AMP receptor protein
MQILENIIIRHPFWENLPQRHRNILGESATVQHFGLRQQIFQTGSEADHFYLINQGRVAIETPFIAGKGIVIIQTLEAGEALGWSWLFPPFEWHFGARAIDIVEVVAFEAAVLRDRASEDHEFGYELALRVGKVMFERLQATRLQLLDCGQPR